MPRVLALLLRQVELVCDEADDCGNLGVVLQADARHLLVAQFAKRAELQALIL